MISSGGGTGLAGLPWDLVAIALASVYFRRRGLPFKIILKNISKYERVFFNVDERGFYVAIFSATFKRAPLSSLI